MNAKERIAEKFAAVQLVIDELIAGIKLNWEVRFAYLFATIAAVGGPAAVLWLAWLFIHWAAQQSPQPTSWCETISGYNVCHN